jgi:hypothetical protein
MIFNIQFGLFLYFDTDIIKKTDYKVHSKIKKPQRRIFLDNYYRQRCLV